MTFRKQAQTQLKSLRDAGYTLNVKLNASNAELHAELVRLETLLEAEAAQLTVDALHVQAAIEQEKAQSTPVIVKAAAKATANLVGAIKVIDLVDRHVITPYVVPRLRLAGAKALLYFMTTILFLLEQLDETLVDIEVYKTHPEMLCDLKAAVRLPILTTQYAKAITMWLYINIIPTVEVEGVRVVW